MSEISEWSTKEEENTHLDELTLSGEGGQYINKVMCAVKEKLNEVDGKLDAVAGGLVFRGTKATYADLEAVTSPAVGDMYSVTALGGENYAWTGEAWDALGTSDSGVVHKSGGETVAGTKTFSSTVIFGDKNAAKRTSSDSQMILYGGGGFTAADGARLYLNGGALSSYTGDFILYAMKKVGDTDYSKALIGAPDGTLTWDGQAIQTSSDERIKTKMAAVPDAVLDAWEAVQWGQFEFLDAVERKGAAARHHTGLIAQHVKRVFESRELDACAYGILCHEEHAATDTDPAVDLWMVRYEEALAMEAACQRRRADRLASKIAELEARLAAMEGASSGNV